MASGIPASLARGSNRIQHSTRISVNLVYPPAPPLRKTQSVPRKAANGLEQLPGKRGQTALAVYSTLLPLIALTPSGLFARQQPSHCV